MTRQQIAEEEEIQIFIQTQIEKYTKEKDTPENKKCLEKWQYAQTLTNSQISLRKSERKGE
jgi:hypothetical protein